jgi:tetratricopeptide (TPR) repeat protein
MRRGGTRALALLALSLFVTSAAAQPTDVQQAREKALELFRQSEEEYRQGRFDEAAKLLEEAHRLHDEPVLLYNLARAYEGMGEREKAVDAYQRFLQRSPDTKDKGAIEKRIQTLNKEIADQRQLQSEKQQLEKEKGREKTAPPPVKPPPESSSPFPGIWPWVTAGAGVALIGTGGVFGVLAQSKRDDADADPEHKSSRRTFRDAESLATTANVFFIVGGVVAAGGVTWIVLSTGAEDAEPSAELRVGPGSVAVGGRF